MLPPSSPCIFDPTPCVQVSHTRVSRWVTMDMWPLDGGMTAPRFDRVFVQDICAGKFLPDIENSLFVIRTCSSLASFVSLPRSGSKSPPLARMTEPMRFWIG